MDIERFKIVNDAFGTGAGNYLLCDLSACLLDVGGGIILAVCQNQGRSVRRAGAPIKQRVQVAEDSLKNSLTVIHCLPVSKLRQESTGLKNEISLRQECATGHLSQSKALREYFQRGWPYYDDSMRRKMLMEQKILDAPWWNLFKEDFLVYLQYPRYN